MKKIRLISVLPISWFVLKEKFQQNASKFAIGNPCIGLMEIVLFYFLNVICAQFCSSEIFDEHWKIKHTNKNLNLNNLSIIENYFRYTKLKCTYPKNI